MYDTLTLDELYARHTELCAEVNAISDHLLDGDKPRFPVLSDQWNLLSTKQGELWETAEAVLTEIFRREQEKYAGAIAAGTRALRDLRNQRGIDA